MNFISRKGATRALPPGHVDLPQRYKESGQPVFIGGSMGTQGYTYWQVIPLRKTRHFHPQIKAGAGRKMSRKLGISKTMEGPRIN